MPIIGSAAGASLRSLGFFGGKAIVTGGTRTEYDDYVVFSFTSTGSLTVSGGPAKGDFLLVGGGDPGSNSTVRTFSYKGTTYSQTGGAGGRAGVVLASPQAELSSGTYTVTVGAASGTSSISSPTTTFYSASGGPGNPFSPGTDGYTVETNATTTGVGGGGAGGAGTPNGATQAPTVGPGGIGVSNSWRTGVAQGYGGGGGGGGAPPGPAPLALQTGGTAVDGGGAGGAGTPRTVTTGAPSATALTGGGGGGGGAKQQASPSATNLPVNPGGAGGTGIVVLRFPKQAVV